MTIHNTNVLKSFSEVTGIRIFSPTPGSDVINDVLENLDSLIPIKPVIYFGGYEKETSIISQCIKAGVQKGECGALITGGGDTKTAERFNIIKRKFTPETCGYLRHVMGIHLGVAIGHHNAKYKMPVDDLCDFSAQTPSELGLLINEMWKIATADAQTYLKYANAFRTIDQLPEAIA